MEEKLRKDIESVRVAENEVASGVLGELAAVAAIILERLSAKKQNEKLFTYARITSLAAIVIGVFNIFFI